MDTIDAPALDLQEVHRRLTAPGSRFEVETLVIRGVRTPVWRHAPRTLVDLFGISRAYADRPFLAFEGERASYGEFAAAATVLAEWLLSQGLRLGDRVAIVLPNLPEWPVAYFAATLIGAIAVPLNPAATTTDLAFALRDCGAKAAIVIGERAAHIGAARDPAARMVLVTCRTDAGLEGEEQPLEGIIGRTHEWAGLAPATLPRTSAGPDDDAAIFYTSGTTGAPKGVVCTHRNLTSHVMQAVFIQLRMLLLLGRPLPDPDPLKSPRTNLVLTPLFHVSGGTGSLLPAMARAGKLVFMRRWSAERAMQLIEQERVTVIGGVPVTALQLAEHRPRRAYDLSSLGQIIYGGAPAPRTLPDRIAKALGGVQAGCSWGMTETSAGFTSHVGPEYRDRPDSCGPAPPVGELEIRDPTDGHRLPVGQSGELWVKGVQVMRGYWNDPAATGRVLVDGWLRTGDVAKLDADGYCYIVDRIKDMVIRGGENIYSQEVEQALCAHPAVHEAAVIGRPHDTLGEEPVAVVSLHEDARISERELRSYVGETLAPFKVPVQIAFLGAPLPRNAAGKVVKTTLPALFH